MDGILNDPNGKPSAMRTASLVTVGTGCVMLLAMTLGYGDEMISPKDALYLVAIGIGGKWVQRITEGRGGAPTSA